MLYDYFCQKCGFEKQIKHSMKESPKIKCNKCNMIMERKIFASAVIFKCGGFYCTDNRSDDDMAKSEHPEAHEAHKRGVF